MGTHNSSYDPQRLAEFLTSAPADLQGWASEQLAQLESPESNEAADLDDVLIDDDADRPLTQSQKSAPSQPAKGGKRQGSKINLVLVALLVAAVVVIIQQRGTDTTAAGEAPHPIPTDGSTDLSAMGMGQPPVVDQERVDELTAAIEADPANIDAMSDLGLLYYDAALFDESVKWQMEILEQDPENVDALLAVGVSYFSLNQNDEALEYWMKAAELAPDTPEPWYNLGFLYLSMDPPDYDKAEEAWATVVEVAPDTELAAAAQGHIDAMIRSGDEG